MKNYFSFLTSRFSLLLIFLSAFLPWIDSPIGSDHYGIGRAAAAIALFGLILCKSALYYGIGISGAIGISLSVFFILHLALFDPFLQHLLDENAQYAQIVKFSETYLPQNLSTEPNIQSVLTIRSITDLFETAVYFSGPGLWFCTAGSLLLLISGLRNAKSFGIAKNSLILASFIQLAVFFYGAWSQHIAEKGDRFIRNGDYISAIRHCENASGIALPALAEQIYACIGEAYTGLGDSDHPASLFYQGLRYQQDKDSDSAIRVWLRARETDGQMKKFVLFKTVLSGHIAWAYIENGLASYQKKEISQAIILWEKALVIDSDQIQAAYYLSRAYFDQESYRKSIEAGRTVLSLSRNKLLNANTLANIGDSYWKLHEFADARKAYQSALKLDSVNNSRIVKALGGT